MTTLEIFEPAMCCSTGVCGPSVNEDLLQITSIVEALNTISDFEAVRYSLSSSPQSFVSNEKVSAILQEKKVEALPITVVDGEVKKVGDYPTLEEITAYTGVRFVMAGEQSGGCCGSADSSCC